MSTTARAPGRVNLIGDHTDYCGGLALPVALDRAVTATFTPHPTGVLRITSTVAGSSFCADLALHADRRSEEPLWQAAARWLAQRLSAPGGTLEVTSSVPVGAGLSSSAAYCVAVALALGAEGNPFDLATLCQQAEAEGGSDVGLLDQLASLAATTGHALRIDFGAGEMTSVELPQSIGLLVVDSGERRQLVTSEYGQRRAECAAAAALLGPLPLAELASIEAIGDPVVRRRARHVRTECARVDAAVAAARTGDLASFGAVLSEGHASLRDDFEVTTPGIDALVAALEATPGIAGARLCGGGFGGAVVAVCEPEVSLPASLAARGWRFRPATGAAVVANGTHQTSGEC